MMEFLEEEKLILKPAVTTSISNCLREGVTMDCTERSIVALTLVSILVMGFIIVAIIIVSHLWSALRLIRHRWFGFNPRFEAITLQKGASYALLNVCITLLVTELPTQLSISN